MSNRSKPMNYLGKGIATVGAAGVCGVMLWKTNGEHGIGWFIVALLIIW